MTSVGGVVRGLVTGDLYRVRIKLSPEIVRLVRASLTDMVQAVTRRMNAIGFRPVYLVTPDLSIPTGEAFSVVARWAGRSTQAYEPRDLTIERFELLEEPSPTIFQEPDDLSDLDRDLSYEEQSTVRYALAHDDNPKHLTGLAWTLEPDFPVAVSLLRSKARLADVRMSATATTKEEREKRNNALRALLGKAYGEAGFRLGWDPIARIENPIERLTLAVRELGEPVSSGLAKYDGVIEHLGGQIPVRRVRQLEEAIQLQKKKPSSAALAVMFPTDVLDVSPLSAEIVKAKKLAAHAFADLERYAEGDTIDERGELFDHAIEEAQRTGREVQSVLLDRIREKIKTAKQAEAIKATIVHLLDASPEAFARPPRLIARELDVDEPIAHAAVSAIEELPGGLRIVLPDVLRAIDPANLASVDPPAGAMPESPYATTGLKGPSTGALQLAYSLARPEGSRVASPAAAQKRVALTNRAANRGHTEAKIAQAALSQASKILQRRKWIEWYKRRQAATP